MANFKKGKDMLEYLKKHPTLPVSLAALGIGVGNLSTNVSRRKEAEKQHKEQVKAMNNLSGSLSKVSASFDEAEKRGAVIVKEKDSKKKRFRIGYYSEMAENVINGGLKGAAAGAFVNGIGLAAAAASKDKHWTPTKALKIVGGSILVGATLGLIFGVTRKIAENSSRNKTNTRVINIVRDILVNRLFKEDKDFTRDPKIADQEKTRVAILVNHSNGDLKLALNVEADPKLEKVCKIITDSLPDKKSKITKRESNRFNEIIITTMSKGNDALLIADITEKFIRAGYPVYLIEVG